MSDFETVKRHFLHICKEMCIDVPRVLPALDTDPSDFTSPDEVRFDMKQDADSEWWHAARVFGHYLCSLHKEEPDYIANVIAGMLAECMSGT